MTQSSEQYDQAILAGITLFMQKTFANVSIDDIVASTGLNRYAIYSAFGTKVDFFKDCVKRYCADDIAALQQLLADPSISATDAARANLYMAAETLCAAGASCLACENMSNASRVSPEAAEICRKYFADKEAMLADFFRRAQSLGTLPSGLDPESAAAAFLIFKFGLSNEVKRSADLAAMKRKIDTFISIMFHGDSV